MASLDQTAAVFTIGDIAIKYLWPLVLGLIGGGFGGAFVTSRIARKRFINRKEKRLFDNIQRPMALIPSGSDGLGEEARLLQSIELLNVDLLPPGKRSVSEVTSHRLAVIRYEDSDTFWHIFEKLADRQIPLIIYSKPVEISPANLGRIQSYYNRYTICNTPVRLVSDVFAIMSVYPEGK